MNCPHSSCTILALTPIRLSWLWSTTDALTNSGYWGEALIVVSKPFG